MPIDCPNIDVSGDVVISRIGGSAQRGGWQMYFKVMGDTDLMGTYQYIKAYLQGMFGSGNMEEMGRLVFQGHTIPQRFYFDRKGSHADQIASTTDQILTNGWCQGIHFYRVPGVCGAACRANYHQFDSRYEMTCGALVKHLLGYRDAYGVPPATNPDWVAHTNLVYHVDENPHGWIELDNVVSTAFAWPGTPNGSMPVCRYIVRETDNMWNTLKQIAKNEFFVIFFDKTNTLHYHRNPVYMATLPDPVMTFDQDFVVGKPVVEVRHTAEVSAIGTVRQVILHAVDDDGDTLHARHPDSPTHVYGKTEEVTYIRCNSQNALDYWAEVHYKWLNRPYTVRWTAPGLCGGLLELWDRVNVTYTGTTANGVHIDWTDKKFWITDIAIVPDEEFGGQSVFTLEAENV